TTAQTLNAGACSGIATVQSQDASSLPANVTSATTVTLYAAPSAGFTFYSDPACGTAIGTAVIAAGTSAASFYFKGTAAGSVLVFTTTAQTLAAGACSAIATVQRRDQFANPVTAGSTTVNLSVAPVTGFTFYSDPACGTSVSSLIIGAGSSTGSFYFKGTAV